MKKRMFTPDFFSDEELVAGLDIPGRLFYLGTWSVAEDSGVIPLSPLSLKMKVFPGDDISPEKLQEYIDTLVNMKKLVPFEHGGKSYGWIKNFHRHQKLDNPSPPTLPIPEWMTWIEGETRKKSCYTVDKSLLEHYISTLCPGQVPDKSRTSPGTCPAELKELKELKESAEAKSEKGQVPDKLTAKDMPLPAENDLSLEKYCREIELQLVIGGANPNYTAKDEEFRTAKQFYESGLPIDFVKSVIADVGERNKAKGKQPPKTLTYCVEPLKEAWTKELIKHEGSEIIQFHTHIAASREPPHGRYIPRGLPPEVAAALEEDRKHEHTPNS